MSYNLPRFSDEKAVGTSVKVNLLDVSLNFIAFLVTGSAVMLAETLEGISDLVSAGSTYFGMKRSWHGPSKKYPFGRGRELYVWSFFATLMMLVALTGLSIYFGFQRFLNPEPIRHIFLAFAILAVSLFSNGYSFSLGFRRILQGRPFWKIGKAFSQSTFLETKITFVLDLIGTLAPASGLMALTLFVLTGNPLFDGLGAMGIGFLMAVFSLLLLKNVRDLIVGITVPDETRELIKKAALEISEVEEVLDLRVVAIGSDRLLVNLEIHVASGLVTEEIEALIDRVKENIKVKVPSAYHIQVELETPDHELRNHLHPRGVNGWHSVL